MDKLLIELSDGSEVSFCNYPLNQSFECSPEDLKEYPHDFDKNLLNILCDPSDYDQFKSSKEAIFLGLSSDSPDNDHRFPFWMPVEFLTEHIFIGGSTGSGKTSLCYRLIAGALKSFGTVVVGEAKAGNKGGPDGAAFTDLSKFLKEHLDDISLYRWPRGNCWFNPITYLESREDRKAFLDSVVRQMNHEGELRTFADQAARIASLVIEYMLLTKQVENVLDQNFNLPSNGKNARRRDSCTLRTLVKFLEHPEVLLREIKVSILEFFPETKEKVDQRSREKINNIAQRFLEIKLELENNNFFRYTDPLYIGSRRAIVTFIDLLSNEDLLYYSECHNEDKNGQKLVELTIDCILYKRSLVVISQPLEMSVSKVVGPLFWDALRNRVIQLGTKPPAKNGKFRENVLAILDETNDLPVGRLGESLGFLREYKLGVVEIAPAIIDLERWERCKQVCQTFISLSPALKSVADFLYENLPNQPISPVMPEIVREEGRLKFGTRINPNIYDAGQRNPGTDASSLLSTGKYTALLYNRNIRGIFWLDLRSNLLAQFNSTLPVNLLKDSLSPKATSNAKNLVSYALGLIDRFKGVE